VSLAVRPRLYDGAVAPTPHTWYPCQVLVTRTERFPLVEFEFRDNFDVAEIDSYAAVMDGYFAGKQRFVCIVLADNLPMPSVTALKHMSAWVKRSDVSLAAYNLGTALVLDSAVLRGAVRFVNSLAPPASPQTVVSRYAEAEAWAIAQLHADGQQPGSVRAS
jgi:hypothetical protein